MEEKATRTSAKQRIFIGVIAVLMLGSFVAVYIGIVAGRGNQTNNVDQEKVAALQKEYQDKNAEVEAEAAKWSDKYFNDFKQYKSEVKSYNASTVNGDGLKTTDIKVGTGRELGESDKNYFAYYIGWCADESIFDSSFNDASNPTSLKTPIDANLGLIEGWTRGVVGMKIGGVRELSIPGELAYGSTKEICGGTNSPLKFVVMALEKTDPLATLSDELSKITNKLVYASYGMEAPED